MRDDHFDIIGSRRDDGPPAPFEDEANEGADGAPALGMEWGALLRTFADMEDALDRLHRSLDEMRPRVLPES